MTVREQALKLPRVEKLRLMEELWMDLSRNGEKFESPQWHEAALRETEERRTRGLEKAIDWDEAKKQLREE